MQKNEERSLNMKRMNDVQMKMCMACNLDGRCCCARRGGNLPMLQR